MGEFVIRWAQDEIEMQTDGWEFQHSIDGNNFNWASDVSQAIPCEVCWETTILIPDAAAFVRSRSFNAAGFSEWSAPISTPEPSFALGLALSLLALLLVQKKTTSDRFGVAKYGVTTRFRVGFSCWVSP